MNLQQLIYFREIARTLHFSRAAENLYISQSSLSYAVNALEKELGVPLFQREKGKRVTLSDYGQGFLPYAENIIRIADSGRKYVCQLGDSLTGGGVVRISYGYINGASVLGKVLKDFNKENRNKNIMIHVQINNASRKIEKDVLSGDVDIAISSSPFVKGLNRILFMKQPLMVFLQKGHPLAGRRRLTIEDIKEEPMIGYYEEGNLSSWINKIYGEYGYYPNVVEYEDDWTTELTYIAMGRGIGILPRIPVDESLISMVPLEQPGHEREIYMYWNQDLSPAGECVKNYLIKYSDHYLKK